MKSAFVQRAARMRSGSSSHHLQTVPPSRSSQEFNTEYESIAASILYKSPLLSQHGLPVFVLNAAAFPDAHEIDYDSLLPYVLARLPGEDDLIAGVEYEVVFFAGGQPETATGEKKNGPGIGWYIQVYQVLSRALRKRLQKIYIVHERSWVRVLTEVFGTIASPKFKKKVVHVSSLSALALFIPLENLLVPPAVYLHDRKVVPDIYVPYRTGKRAFAAREPLPRNSRGDLRLPRVLREATSFILQDTNLTIEGIFRIPPHSTLLGIVKEAYDRGQHFIVWKEGKNSQVDPGMDAATLAGVQEPDVYGVPLATGLVKVWYRELKNPILPERSYEAIRQVCAAAEEDINRSTLKSLLSPDSTTSPLSHTSRLIITWHLLPLLSIVSSHHAFNKMTAENLAVCFAPALICGSDQLQDAKMTTVIKKLLTVATREWSQGLATDCGTSDDQFRQRLRAPKDQNDYEDPLPDASTRRPTELEDKMNYINLQDDDASVSAPPLPPRASSLQGNRSAIPPLAPLPRRKPAPTVAVPPRYSTLMTGSSAPPMYTSGHQTMSDSKQLHDEQNGFPVEKSTRSQSIQLDRPSADCDAPQQGIKRAATIPIPVPTSSAHPASTPPLLSPSLADIQSANSSLRSVSGHSTRSDRSDEAVFVKPTWAASSRQGSLTSDRKPTPPPIAVNGALHTGDRIDSGTHAPPSFVPKPRTPSPGLLQRMQSWESRGDGEEGARGRAGGNGGPGERGHSVDDLKRLYEERAGAVGAVTGLARKGSSASQKSSK